LKGFGFTRKPGQEQEWLGDVWDILSCLACILVQFTLCNFPVLTGAPPMAVLPSLTEYGEEFSSQAFVAVVYYTDICSHTL
jgi:hypothetical protein